MNCILYPSWQKFYNALDAITSISTEDTIFENIRHLDNFFSEYRNITFVMQSAFKKNGRLAIYEKFQKIHLTGNTKWLKDTRNDVIHDHPFKLEKRIELYQYSAIGKRKLSETVLSITHDKAFSELKDLLKDKLDEAINDNLTRGYIDVYIGIDLCFIEEGKNIDIYSEIIKGIQAMCAFMNDVSNEVNCRCKLCTEFRDKTNVLIDSIISKTVNFHFDYQYDRKQGKWTEAMKGMIFLGNGTGQMRPDIDGRIAIKDSPFYQEFYHHGNLDIHGMFKKFTISNIVICSMQNNDIMPNFLIVFSDHTVALHTFVSSTKTGFYREISDIADMIEKERVRAVFYNAIFYLHTDVDGFFKKSYEERTKNADKEVLKSIMISSNLYEINLDFDMEKLDDMEYVSDVLNNEEETPYQVGMLRPIKEKFILNTNRPYSMKARIQMIRELL